MNNISFDYLDKITFPEDLRNFRRSQTSKDLRQYIVNSISEMEGILELVLVLLN